MLLVGGGETNTLFMRFSLVNEIHLTLEPVVFGNGKNLVAEDDLEMKFKLKSIEKLNSRGTLHLIYTRAR